MRVLISLLIICAGCLVIQSCNDDETGPTVEAIITADSTATPGDTVWLYSYRSTGADSILWSINIQPGADTIQDTGNDTAYLIPTVNGVYSIKLTVSKGNDKHSAFHDITVSGANILTGTISNDTILPSFDTGTGADYLVTGMLIVSARLEFDVQVVLEFTELAGIIVTPTGSIFANNVTFRASEGNWRGIQLLSKGNVFISSTISGGGSESLTLNADDKANLVLSENAEASLSGNTFSKSGGYGLVIRDNAKLVYNENTLTNAFINNKFISNTKGPMRIPVYSLAKFNSPDLSKASAGTFIEIYESEHGSSLESDPVINDFGIPYHITGVVTFKKPLTILKGCEIYFDEDAGFDIYSTLQINGTTNAPVTCGSHSGTTGSWSGIHVRTSNAIISNSSIQNSGGSEMPGLDEKAAVIVGGNLNMQNSAVTGSGGIGLWLRGEGAIQYASNFQGNSFSDNLTTNIRLGLDDVHKVISGNTLSPFSSETPLVEIRKGKSDFLDNWLDISTGIDYRVVDSVSIKKTKNLTIEPGVKIEFAPGTAFNISGSLNASGTSAKAIEFIGASTTQGSWRGIFIQTDNSVVMKNVIISDGGGDATDKANVIIMPAAQSVSITNSSITNSAGYAVLVKAGASGFDINDASSFNQLSGILGGYHDENK